MPEYIYDITQQSPEWDLCRIGSIGGSSISSVLAKGEGKTRKALLYTFAAEILTGKKTDGFHNSYMDRGNDFEAEAINFYEFVHGVEVQKVGIIKSDISGLHYSPDGLILADGMLEVKVRIPSVFVEIKDTGKNEKKYVDQCHHGLFVSGRKWVDLTNYCPEMPNPEFTTRIYRDEKKIAEIKSECLKFIEELNALVERMR